MKLSLQDTLKNSLIGDLKCAAGILLSGNNFLKIQHMSEIMGLHFINSRMFYAIQNHYICPGVEETFATTLSKRIEEVQDKNVVLFGEYTVCFLDIQIGSVSRTLSKTHT